MRKNFYHHGFQYKIGLNILIEKFEPLDHCSGGGFYRKMNKCVNMMEDFCDISDHLYNQIHYVE